MKKYYFMKSGTQVGPCSLEEIKAFHLPADTLVWYEELGSWKKIQDAPEIWLGTHRHMVAPSDNSKNFWYVGGVIAFVLLAWVFSLALKKKEGSKEVAEKLASQFAYYAMKTCNPSTGSNAIYNELSDDDWECEDKRYTIEVTSSWDGVPYGGGSCNHAVKVRLKVNEDGSNRTWEALETNDCMEQDARGDYNIRVFLGR